MAKQRVSTISSLAVVALLTMSAGVAAAEAIESESLAATRTLQGPASVPSQSTDEIDELIAEMEASFSVQAASTTGQIQNINAEYPAVASYLSVDNDQGVIVVGYDGGADADAVAAYIGAIEAVAANSEHPISILDLGFSFAEQIDLVDSFGTEPEKWVDVFGGLITSVIPLGDGSIQVTVDRQEGEPVIEVAGFTIIVNSVVSESSNIQLLGSLGRRLPADRQ